MATATCGGSGTVSAAPESAALSALPGVIDVEDDGLVEGDDGEEMDTEDAEVPLMRASGKTYFWGQDRYVGHWEGTEADKVRGREHEMGGESWMRGSYCATEGV